VIEQALADVPARPATDLDTVLAADAEARRDAEAAVRRLSGGCAA
jgi:hypothetical protein